MSARVIGITHLFCASLLAGVGAAVAQEAAPVNDPSKTKYGQINRDAPAQLRVFSFLIGKWDGKGKTRLPDGTVAEFPVTWIGRYILDGMAIADEAHAPAPDGSPYLGISLRQYDPGRKSWIIEFLWEQLHVPARRIERCGKELERGADRDDFSAARVADLVHRISKDTVARVSDAQ
jgi:hypothetical protein